MYLTASTVHLLGRSGDADLRGSTLSEPFSVHLESSFHLPLIGCLAPTVSTQQGLSAMLNDDIRLAAVADHHAVLAIACSLRELPSTNPAVHTRPSVSSEGFNRRRTYLSTVSVRDAHFSHDALRRAGINHRFASGD
jgi:hypothetical protein